MENLVILDFGSNSARLAINRISTGGEFKEIKRIKETTRLAEGMGQQNGTKKMLEPKAVERTLNAVKYFIKVYQNYPHSKVCAIATAAVREAENSAFFLQSVKKMTGVDVKILSGQDEAYYDYLGVINSLPLKDCIIVDMGGGSCEIILVKDRKAQHLECIPYGAISLTERFGAEKVMSAKQLFKFETFVQEQYQKLGWLNEAHGVPIVLLGGCNRTVARIQKRRLHQGNLEQIHGFKITRKDFTDVYADLLGKNRYERKAVNGMEQNRADIILGGMTPIVMLLQILQSSNVFFSESGAREGFMHTFLNEQN
ncbi:Ppx/GppA phosphatase family protein [Liquorilactobacillus aquaticus]|uniref:Ppx/GppA phosphatase family protein n=1 Tax=Liquorilactobacillus aquaticus TaxID=392566 RepID=UPI00070C9F16|nr:Ppx/GppA phosphatase family protein [Liquorilactobacillus aquaticus]